MFNYIRKSLIAIVLITSSILMVSALNNNFIDLGITSKSEKTEKSENYPGYLNITYSDVTKKLSIVPIDVPSNIKPYKAITIRDENGRNVLSAEHKNNKTEVVANNLGAISNSSITGYELKDIVTIELNKTYYLYQLDENNKVHSTKLAGDFWKTKSGIAPTVYLTTPAIDKATQALVDDCLFSKPKFDGKEYAWKGDVMVSGFSSNNQTTQVRIRFNQLPKVGEKFLEIKRKYRTYLSITTAELDNNQRLLFIAKDTYNKRLDTIKTTLQIETNQWAALLWKTNFQRDDFYWNGNKLKESRQGTSITEFKLLKQSEQWEIADIVMWNNGLDDKAIKNAVKNLPSPNDNNVMAFFDMDEGNGTQLNNSKGGSTIIATAANGNCKTDWVESRFSSLKNSLATDCNALNLNGSEASLNGIDLTNKSFTIEFLAKGYKKDSYEGIVSQGTNSNYLLIGYLVNNRFRFGFGNENLTSPKTYTNENDWHHWACVFDNATKKQTLYRDGVEIASRTASIAFNINGKITIGRLLDFKDWKYNGQIDELRIWEKALSKSEINQFKDGLTIATPKELVAYLPFSKLQNNKLINTVDNSLIDVSNVSGGSIIKGKCIKSNNSNNNQPPVANVNKPTAFNLDGKDIYAISNNSIDLSNKSFTIEFWAEKENDGVVIGHGTLGKAKEHLALKATKSGLHHYAYVFDNEYKVKITFIDGKVEKAEKFESYTANTPLVIGRAAAGGQNLNPFKGKIDEVRIWNKALDPRLVALHSLWKYDKTTADLLLYYNFDKNNDKTVTDIKGTNNAQILIPINPKYATAVSNLKLQQVGAAPPTITKIVDKSYHAGTQGKKTIPSNFQISSSNPSWIMYWAKFGSAKNSEIKIEDAINLNYNSNEAAILKDLKWHHIAYKITKTRGHSEKIELYIDGKKIHDLGEVFYKNYSYVEISGDTYIDDLVCYVEPVQPFDIKKTAENLPHHYRPYSKILNGASIQLFETFDNGSAFPHLTKKIGDYNYSTPTPKSANDFTLNLDGNDDYLEISNGIDLKNKSFTIEFLAKAKRTNTNNYILSMDGSGKQLKVGFNNQNQFVFGFGEGDAVTGGQYTDDKVHHWACTYDNSNKVLKIFRDGEFLECKIVTNDMQIQGDLLIGKLGNQYFKGELDELRIWGKARTFQEIRANILKELNGNETGLMAYHKFNQKGNTRALDHLKKYNANLKNIDANSAFIIPYGLDKLVISNSTNEICRKFKYKYALQFDGKDDYVDTKTKLGSGENSMAVAFWVKRAEMNRNEHIISDYYHSGNGNELGFKVGFINNQFVVSMIGKVIIRIDAKYTDTEWHHWTVAFECYSHSRNDIIVYRDGIELAKQGYNKRSANSSIRNICIGGDKNENKNYFKGQIDEVVLLTFPDRYTWDSNNAISFMGLNLNCSGCSTTYFNFNEGKGNTANAAKGSKIATLHNMDVNKVWTLWKR